jgi:choline dehydrogenase-like flavoprotein
LELQYQLFDRVCRFVDDEEVLIDVAKPDRVGAGTSIPEVIGWRGRWRGSTAQTFLREARGRANLRVEANAQTGRLLFEGKRCVGVEVRRGGTTEAVRANREVIVCGGTVNSPHILQISGIGPAEHLRALGHPLRSAGPRASRRD